MAPASSKPTIAGIGPLETLKVTQDGFVCHVELNRPPNAMNKAFWREYREVFQVIAKDTSCRCVIVSAAGKHFTVGLDIKEGGGLLGDEGSLNTSMDTARRARQLFEEVMHLQDTFTVMEHCPQPVIVCAHGACIGGGIDLLCAADIRMASSDAFFSIKEVDIGLAADVGTLQRIERIVGNTSLVRELAYTARRFSADEAKGLGFLSQVHPTRDAMLAAAKKMAAEISTKSPVAIWGTKANLNYSRDHSLPDSLRQVALWNAAALQTADVPTAAMASLSKGKQPEFSKL